MAGLLSYLAVVFFMLRPPPGSGTTLTLAAGALCVVSLAMAWSIPASVRSRVRREHAASPLDEGSLVSAWMSASIPRMAMLEGPGLFGVIAYQLEGQLLALLPTAIAVLGLLLKFPNMKQFRRFHEEITGIRNY